MKKQALFLTILTLTMLTLSACGRLGLRVDEGQSVSRTFGLEGINQAEVQLEMQSGELHLRGGAPELFEGEMTFEKEAYEPAFSYVANGETGRLHIQQPDRLLPIVNRGAENSWNVRLNDDVPTDLSVSLGAGESTLNLNTLNLQRLEATSGAGDTEITVPGSLNELAVSAGAGMMKLDLTAPRSVDLDATVAHGIGDLIILLPADTAVTVTAGGALGRIDAPDLVRDGDRLVSSTDAGDGPTLNVHVEMGMGEVDLRVVE